MMYILRVMAVYSLLTLGVFSLYMFIDGASNRLATWLWLIPAQIIMQPAYSKLMLDLVGTEKDNDDEKN